MESIITTFSQIPRTELLTGKTPLEPLKRLSEHLGIDLWVKRDDLTGLGGGGNKVRQLEYYFGAAQAQNADTILITGAVQSNYVRTAAAAAAKLGLKSVLQLEDRVSGMGDAYHISGNVFLGQLLGAEHIYYADGEDEAGADRALHAHADSLKSQGHNPYVIPLGLDNKPLGALGYINAAKEVLDQDRGFDVAVVASGSGATHAGLLAGLRIYGSNMPVHGICVRRNAVAQTQRLNSVIQKISSLLGQDTPVTPAEIQVSDSALAPGYGKPGPKTAEAMKLMARFEGLFLDPVYTAKTFAGLLDLLESGQISQGMRVLFIHTGGFPALFSYQDQLQL